jgi:hypothetical protein
MNEQDTSTFGPLSSNHSRFGAAALAVTVMISNSSAKTDMVNVSDTGAHSEPVRNVGGSAALQSAVIRGARVLSASINEEGEARLERLLAAETQKPQKLKVTKVR